MTLLTVDEARTHITTSLIDAALQRLLDDAEAQIVAFAGDVSSAEELVSGGSGRITVSRPISSVTTIVERDGWSSPITLHTSDWEQVSRFTLGRLRYGTNSSSTWRGPVRVTYEPVDDTASRKAVQLELLRIEITNNPGLSAETVGSWTQQYVNNSAWNPAEARAAALARLREAALFAVV